ncbi:type I restriction-modification system subunit M [Parachryseolinea silvisoli]|uniref:type I restriction-modification system subunit M n=1 Tax=Parachryseolinea silvisoli TaxID=2873601 RepID=UPI00226581B7|nr:type I restriction-modification system subunit M [Parachryseolinea silvisoli]MCD9017514.1 type I restriction-modification system subunit M [Parachryseolinea silvisoli]
MAIKKSELYSSLWESCNQLRGGMDASQYKDYVLAMLFIKYVSDKYANTPFAPITIPKGSTFQDMVKLKGKPEIGDFINKKIFAPIRDANKMSDFANFNDDEKLGTGKDKIDKLTKLIAIFENPDLDFSKNRADDDDILGDAYEFLMRHFATDSGKSKGQFYTPAEVSRILAKIIGINKSNSTASTTIYDPTCGSGSLLIRAGEEAEKAITLYGQEMDIATVALASMNMVLHNQAQNLHGIRQGNTIADPKFIKKAGTDEMLETFDYAVANPPFSFASWTNGLIDDKTKAVVDRYNRFAGFGIPPEKNGDYAFLLHIIKSLKSKGKGGIILPHGVLFRGGAEGEIRKKLITKGYIKGIIGLPPNLFYGTGIPACIIVIDKENVEKRKGIFIIDASKEYMKDGNKNRLREQDIHKIVDVFNKQLELAKYSRMVSLAEIADPKNDYNLNIPRYIDNQEAEDIHDIEAHLLGDIPNADIDALAKYWEVYPTLRKDLFSTSKRKKYSKLKVTKEEINNTIFNHPEFLNFIKELDKLFNTWRKRSTKQLKELKKGFKPRQVINEISEDLLKIYSSEGLVDKYDVYQHLMTYWNSTMQDDCYLIAANGWKADLYNINKGKKEVILDSDLVPKTLVIDRFFKADKKAIDAMEAKREALTSEIEELTDEYSGEEGFFSMMDKVNRIIVSKRLKEIKNDKKSIDEIKALEGWLRLADEQTAVKKEIETAALQLSDRVTERYKTLAEDDVKILVVDYKWMAEIERRMNEEMDQVSETITLRITQLAERYELPLPQQNAEVLALERKVNTHLKKMGFAW